VPVAPSFLDLDDEETVAYNARRTPAVSLPALRAECLEAGDSSPIILDDADIEIVSTKPASVASTIHRIQARPTIDDLAPPRSTVRVSLATKAETQRVVVSSHPPESGRRVRAIPTHERSLLSKLLFLVMFVVVLMIIATDIAIARDLPWLDCRPYLLTAWKLVSQRIPWESLPKVPRF
jgi:hypothetical protein